MGTSLSPQSALLSLTPQPWPWAASLSLGASGANVSVVDLDIDFMNVPTDWGGGHMLLCLCP